MSTQGPLHTELRRASRLFCGIYHYVCIYCKASLRIDKAINQGSAATGILDKYHYAGSRPLWRFNWEPVLDELLLQLINLYNPLDFASSSSSSALFVEDRILNSFFLYQLQYEILISFQRIKSLIEDFASFICNEKS